MTDDLTAWLREQLDADERVEVAILRRTPDWRVDPEPWETNGVGIVDTAGNSVAVAIGDYAARHIAYHDPARALAEVEAKRVILDLHAGEHDCPVVVTGVYPADYPDLGVTDARAGKPWSHVDIEHFAAGYPCPTIQALAQPYAGRPGLARGATDPTPDAALSAFVRAQLDEDGRLTPEVQSLLDLYDASTDRPAAHRVSRRGVLALAQPYIGRPGWREEWRA